MEESTVGKEEYASYHHFLFSRNVFKWLLFRGLPGIVGKVLKSLQLYTHFKPNIEIFKSVN